MKKREIYQPSNEFINRHNLCIDEQETWVDLDNAPSRDEATASIAFNKDTGLFHLYTIGRQRAFDTECLFSGYLPDEAALEAVIKWTRWGTPEAYRVD